MTTNGHVSIDNETTDLINTTMDPYGSADMDDAEDDDEGEVSFQANKRGVVNIGAANVMMSTRGSSALLKTPSGGEYDTVPTLVEDNVVLVCDVNLDWHSQGGFYYDEAAFYNPKVAPNYAITVSPSIYQKVLNEVHLSKSVPCGMYFCCQGGDGAHTGEAHEDFVDIQLAWLIMGVVFGGMMVVSILP